MNNIMPIKNSVRVLLINQDKELFLMYVNDPKVMAKDASYYGPFWITVGGTIEPGEKVMDAAIRELKEETGLTLKEVTFGPKVWYGEFEMIMFGNMTCVKQQFIVCHTKNKQTTTQYLTSEEQRVVIETAWFNIEDIKNLDAIIYPVELRNYLPDILEKRYPLEPLWIDLGKKPTDF